jgi:hypothetical protein
MVLDHLCAHPQLDFSPAELANALGRPKSRGAVINACKRWVALGRAVRTQHRPQRYQATTAAHPSQRRQKHPIQIVATPRQRRRQPLATRTRGNLMHDPNAGALTARSTAELWALVPGGRPPPAVRRAPLSISMRRTAAKTTKKPSHSHPLKKEAH